MEFPKISIVTPCLNAERFIEDTIVSIISQNYPNLEYIIIDGGSIDGTIDILKKYESKITFWETNCDNGQYFALQRGFDLSTGDIMAWLNADDMLHCGALFAVAEIFSKFPDIRWIMGQPTVFNQDGSCVQIVALNDAIWHSERILEDEEHFIQQESTFWCRELWEQAGSCIDTSLELAGDFELWARFFRYTSLHTVTTILGGFRFSNAQQRSVRCYDKYLEEVSAIRYRELELLPRLQRLTTRMRNRLAVLVRPYALRETPILRHLYYAIYGPAPDMLSFDFSTWSYVLTNNAAPTEEKGKAARTKLLADDEPQHSPNK
ncbi:MAG: hypothetical protein QOJ02_3029 [Acidobacteriota bacterium]|jgi:glycosyltransferase involved in cell wall biosynthesis|nr:hypothetical protein [Acidobacteriota bacterium]